MRKEFWFLYIYMSGVILGNFVCLIYLNNDFLIYLITSLVIVLGWYWFLLFVYKKLEEKEK